MMMAPPQVVGVLLKKPGEQTHSRLSALDPQETKIRGELYVEDLNERRIVLVRMGWLWVEGTKMKLPLRALNLRQATSGICQPHVLALGFTLSNSQGDVLATFWADTEPIYWSWVRAIAAELVRQTPPRAQRCLNFLEILTICPRGPLPLPGSPTDARRRSRSELRCWLGDGPIVDRHSRGGATVVEETRRRARSELRGWSSSNSSDEDLHLSEFRGIRTSILPQTSLETTMTTRIWGCSESSEGSDDSLPWVGGCRSSVDSIDSAPSVPEPDAREIRIQRYKEARRRENEARSRRVLEEDAKRRKARREENNNNSNNNNNNNNINSSSNSNNNINYDVRTAKTSDAKVTREKLCDNTRNNANNTSKTSNNVETTSNNVASVSGDASRRSHDLATSSETIARDETPRNNVNNGRTTPNNVETTSNNGIHVVAVSNDSGRRSYDLATSLETIARDKTSRNNGDNGKTTDRTTAVVSMVNNDDVATSRLSGNIDDDCLRHVGRRCVSPKDRANNSETSTTATTTTTPTTTTANTIAETTASGRRAARRLTDIIRSAMRSSEAKTSSEQRLNNGDIVKTTKTTKTTRRNVANGSEINDRSYERSERERNFGDARNNVPTTRTTKVTTTTTTATTAATTDPFVRAAATVDAITRRLPPLRVSGESPVVRFRDNDGYRRDDAKNNNNNNNNNNVTSNYNNCRTATTRCKPDSPPSPGVSRTDSSERRSRARERRNVREKSQISILQEPQQQQQQQQQLVEKQLQQQQQQQQQQCRIPENSLKTIFLQERRERLSLLSRIPIASNENTRTTSNTRLSDRSLENRDRGAISLPRIAGFEIIGETATSPCEEDVARLLERCQRVDRYVPVREKLTLFESLSRMGGRLARSTEDLGRSLSRPSPKGKQRARSLHDLNRSARSVPVREMCRLFEGERDGERFDVVDVTIATNSVADRRTKIGDDRGIGKIGDDRGIGKIGDDRAIGKIGKIGDDRAIGKIGDDRSFGKIVVKDPPISILKNNGTRDVPPCVRTSTRRKHYQK